MTAPAHSGHHAQGLVSIKSTAAFASKRVKASRLNTLIPCGTDRWKSRYHQRGSVERESGHLKHEWAMLPLRVRRIFRGRLHVDLTILARLASALLGVRAS